MRKSATNHPAPQKICIIGLDALPVLAPEFGHHRIGGESVQQTLIAKALLGKGYDVSMVVADYGQTEGAKYDGITTYKAYASEAGIPGLRFIHPRWTGLWGAMHRAAADVYYTSCASMTVGLAAMFCRRYRRGLVFRLASDADADPDRLLIRYYRDKKLYEYGLRRADAILAQTMTQKQALEKNYGVSDSVVADMLVDSPARDLDLEDRDIEVLWVANFRELKRPELAIELANRLPHRHVHLVGGASPETASLYENIKRLACETGNVSFHGPLPYHAAARIYDRARVFINTSAIEGFPNSYLQSWRRGVPVVASFDPDGIIGRMGLGIAADTVEEMVTGVESLLSDADLWLQTSQRCRRYMERFHGDDTVLQPYLDAITLAKKI